MIIRKRRGQFQVLAAFLVLTILVSAIVSSYYQIEANSKINPVTVSNTVNEVENSLWKLLGFAVGYYSSILHVTGDYTYAQQQTRTYLSGGLLEITRNHPDWGVTFFYDSKFLQFNTTWFGVIGSTSGNWIINYSLPTLNLKNIKIKITDALDAQITHTAIVTDPVSHATSYWCHVNVTEDNSHPNLLLSKDDFKFFKYNKDSGTWEYEDPVSEPILTSGGEYQIEIPTPSIDNTNYYLQVTDQRGIFTDCAFIQGKFDPATNQWINQPQTVYQYKLTWDAAYNPLTNDILTLELLQNGTIRWLGHSIPILNGAKQIPPVPVKAIRVNATINGINTPIPFQVEDWEAIIQSRWVSRIRMLYSMVTT